MSLILKQRHWKYTVISTFCVLPILLTALAAVSVWLIDFRWGSVLLEFILARSSGVLLVIWIVLPLTSWYYAHKAFARGTIDRWRPINNFTKKTAVLLLGAVVIISVIGLLG